MACLGLDAVVSRRINMVDMTEFRKVDVVWTTPNEGPSCEHIQVFMFRAWLNRERGLSSELSGFSD